MSQRSRVLTFGLPVLGVASLGAGVVMVAVNRPAALAESLPRAVLSAPVDEASGSTGFIGAVGVSEPRGEAVRLASQVSGVVSDVRVSVGDSVKRGDVLFLVDSRQAEAAIALRAASLAVARADVESVRAGIGPAEAMVASARAGLASAEAGVLAAQADASDRANQLRNAEAIQDKRAIADEELQRRRFALQQSQARVAVAEAEVEVARAAVTDAVARLERLVRADGSDGADLLAALHRISAAESELASAKIDAEVRSVTSPFDAQVLQVNVRPGEFAAASVSDTGLVVLGRLGAAQLRVEIDEVDIPRFTSSAQASSYARGNPTVKIPLTLAYVEPLVVAKSNLAGRTQERVDTRVLQVVYDLPESYNLVGLGQQFDVYIQAQQGSKP